MCVLDWAGWAVLGWAVVDLLEVDSGRDVTVAKGGDQCVCVCVCVCVCACVRARVRACVHACSVRYRYSMI